MDQFKTLRGVVEVTAYKNGEQFHYDKSENTVTLWAKHAVMHLMTGESFTSHGKQRDFTGHGLTTNPDGSLVSGEQFFTDYATYGIDERWARNTADYESGVDIDNGEGTDDNLKYPFFPTKMLFGTGFEYKQWTDISADDQTFYESYGYQDTNFGTPDNDYTNTWNGTSLDATKTMNDTVNRTLTETITTEDYGIKGAIKAGGLEDYGTQSSRLIISEDSQYLDFEYKGIGKPCFVYCKRDDRFYKPATEIDLNRDDDKIENKITFSITMPEQTGSPKEFYPYNGYTLKEAGLFADGRIVFDNSTPTTGAIKTEYDRMPYGILFAKRNIAPITKSPEVSINVQWTIYL